MIITGAFIAEHAEVVDAKLNVTGGVPDFWALPVTGDVVPLHVVVLMQAGPDDHNQPYRVQLKLFTPAGEEEVLVDQEIDVDAHRGENRFGVLTGDFSPQTTGRYSFHATIGNSTFIVPLVVIEDD